MAVMKSPATTPTKFSACSPRGKQRAWRSSYSPSSRKLRLHVLPHRANQDDPATLALVQEGAGFVEIVPAALEGTAANPIGVELLLPHGLRVRIEHGFGAATLARPLQTAPRWAFRLR
jgi:hypothetical protein